MFALSIVIGAVKATLAGDCAEACKKLVVSSYH